MSDSIQNDTSTRVLKDVEIKSGWAPGHYCPCRQDADFNQGSIDNDVNNRSGKSRNPRMQRSPFIFTNATGFTCTIQLVGKDEVSSC